MFMGSNSYFFPTKLFMSKRFRTTKVLQSFLDLNPSFNPQGEVGGYKKTVNGCRVCVKLPAIAELRLSHS